MCTGDKRTGVVGRLPLRGGRVADGGKRRATGGGRGRTEEGDLGRVADDDGVRALRVKGLQHAEGAGAPARVLASTGRRMSRKETWAGWRWRWR